MKIILKRAYETPQPEDGKRILVDRLWPRGLTSDEVAVVLWAKDIAPSTELRKWFAHDPAKWATFQSRYRQELNAKPEIVENFRKELKGTITFVFGAKDIDHTHALTLKNYFEK